jgi:hypothetical protein
VVAVTDNIELAPGSVVQANVSLINVPISRNANGDYLIGEMSRFGQFTPAEVVSITRPKPVAPDTVKLGDRWVLSNGAFEEPAVADSGGFWHGLNSDRLYPPTEARTFFVRVFTDDDPLRAEA